MRVRLPQEVARNKKVSILSEYIVEVAAVIKAIYSKNPYGVCFITLD